MDVSPLPRVEILKPVESDLHTYDPSMFSTFPGGLGCVILGRVGADWIPQATPYQSSPHRGFALPGRKERVDMVVWGRDSSPDCSSPCSFMGWSGLSTPTRD